MNEIQKKLSCLDEEEIKKCNQSPVYLYNKYIRKEGEKEFTQKEYDAMIEKSRNPLKYRRNRYSKLLTPEECFKPRFLPDFLKK